MSDPIQPAAVPPSPQTPVAGLRKGHMGAILGAGVALFLVFKMFSGSSSTARSADNPVIGSWSLAETDKTYCATHEVFQKDTDVEIKGGVSTTYPAIYLVKPGYVDVATGNLANYSQYDETGPDEITLRLNSLVVVASCKYHRD